MNKIFSNKKVKPKLSLLCMYPKGYIVKEEGERCDRIGIISSGSLKMVHYTIDGDEVELAELHKGDIFGDFLIFSKSPNYPGTIIAREESLVFYIERNDLSNLIATSYTFREFYLSNLSRKALEYNAHNKLLLQPSLKEKILYYIRRQMAITNQQYITLPSHERFATLLNVRRPSLSRILSQMHKEGIVDYDKNKIKIIE